jgi:hypothetical protein
METQQIPSDSHMGRTVVGEAGLEPTTPGLEGRCSIQLSYSPVPDIVSSSAVHSQLRRVTLHDRRQCQVERFAPPLFGMVRV